MTYVNAEHWTADDHEALQKADNFAALASIALGVLPRLPQPLGQVCGPITTGGLGSREANMRKFKDTIMGLHQSGVALFDQCIFETRIFELAKGEWTKEHNTSLLDEFYYPILSSGHIKRLYFIPGWESSHGATWEHEQAQKHGLEIIYLPKE